MCLEVWKRQAEGIEQLVRVLGWEESERRSWVERLAWIDITVDDIGVRASFKLWHIHEGGIDIKNIVKWMNSCLVEEISRCVGVAVVLVLDLPFCEEVGSR
jgi:hypothetical protein